MPPQPASVYHSLPLSFRQEIADSVRGSIATFRGPTLDGDDLNDVIRWTLEAYGRTSAYDDGFAEGVEIGRQMALEEIAALAPEEDG